MFLRTTMSLSDWTKRFGKPANATLEKLILEQDKRFSAWLISDDSGTFYFIDFLPLNKAEENEAEMDNFQLSLT